MKVVKAKKESKKLNISDVDSTYVIVVKFSDLWHIVQADRFRSDNFNLLLLDKTSDGMNSLTIQNHRGPRSIEYWFDECQKMHVFKTTKKAFKFLIKKL